jgi:hypothetical protein
MGERIGQWLQHGGISGTTESGSSDSNAVRAALAFLFIQESVE